MSPSKTVGAGGVTITSATTCSTVTEADAESPPAVAVTVAVPGPVERTSPEPVTVATSVSLVTQSMVTPVIGRPFWSRRSAESWAVASSAVSRMLSGAIDSVVGCGGGGGRGGGGAGVGAAVSPPQERVRATVVSPPAIRRTHLARVLRHAARRSRFPLRVGEDRDAKSFIQQEALRA